MASITSRFTCDNCYAVYLGDASGVTQKIYPTGTDLGIVNGTAAEIADGESVSFNASPNDWFYLIAWSDGGGRQGLLGSFKGAVVLNTGDPGWEVLPTKQRLPTVTNVPTMADINSHIAGAQAADWKIPTVGPDYANTAAIYGSTFLTSGFTNGLAAMGANPKWVWYDSGNDTRINTVAPIPFMGFDHDEFLIFRFPLKLVTPQPSPCQEGKDKAKTALEALVEHKHNHLSSNRECPDYHPLPGGDDREPCKAFPIPNVKPCFYLHWGDGPRDIIETEDFEVLMLSVCNPYSNLSFKNLVISDLEVVHADGSPVELLPDGTPSVMLVPSKMISICGLAPCSCCHLELVLKSSGALEGFYKIKFNYCIEEASFVFAQRHPEEFDIELVIS
ncbi:MAG: hypothetical protein ACKVUS_18780 [Saprospiraceae bacterium]